MTASTPVVLLAIADAELCAAADRVVAAVGARSVRVATPVRWNWSPAAAIILDGAAARRCATDGLPRRDGVFLVAAAPGAEAWPAAVDVGAQHVCALPGQDAELVQHLAEAVEAATMSSRRGRVIAVAAGRGGGGASCLSAAVALRAGEALLVDLDPCGGGVDLVLGAERVPGLRWPDIKVRGGRLGWAGLRDVLPRKDGVSIVSGSRAFHEIDPGAVPVLIDAGRRAGATVVCDLPRQLTPAAIRGLQNSDLAVLVTTCDVRGVSAAAATAAELRTVNPALGLVVRGPSPGGLRAREVATAVAVPLIAAVRPEPMLDRRLEQGGLRLRGRSPLDLAARAVLQAARGDNVRWAA